MNWLPEEEFKGLSDNFFDDFINHIDFPLEDIDTTNGEGGDWDAKFKELEPPPMDMFTTFPSEFNSCGVASKAGIKKNVSVLVSSSLFPIKHSLCLRYLRHNLTRNMHIT